MRKDFFAKLCSHALSPFLHPAFFLDYLGLRLVDLVQLMHLKLVPQ
uniref:Uncharacterized protein n=1 Tax=Rhizophora mucronata TaxID=61149 RepID=A0A2P2MY40_RHIMU